MASSVTCLAIPGDYSEVNFKTHVVLQSNDEPTIEFVVLRDAVKMSDLIKTMLEDDVEEEARETVIPIPNVNAKVLTYVIEYCNHHCQPGNKAAEIKKPLTDHIDKLVSEWDRVFIFTDLVKDGNEKEHRLLLECMLAANFLGVQDLLTLTAATMASMIRGKVPEEIRELLGLENDFTPEELAQMQKENRWVD